MANFKQIFILINILCIFFYTACQNKELENKKIESMKQDSKNGIII
jgi:hypothetical protein